MDHLRAYADALEKALSQEVSLGVSWGSFPKGCFPRWTSADGLETSEIFLQEYRLLINILPILF